MRLKFLTKFLQRRVSSAPLVKSCHKECLTSAAIMCFIMWRMVNSKETSNPPAQEKPVYLHELEGVKEIVGTLSMAIFTDSSGREYIKKLF